MPYTKRFDGRKDDELREMQAKVGVIKNADGSAMFCFGKSKAIAAVYGPRILHPQHLQNPTKARLKCIYDMLSFSVNERKRPGPNRRSSEISLIIEKSLSPVINLNQFPQNTIDVYIQIIEANASTRTAGINAASLALAHAGIPMSDLVCSVSVGKIGGKLVVDLTKDEEDFEEKGKKYATDIPMTYIPRLDKFSMLQLDGNISRDELLQAMQMARKVSKQIHDVQIKALKDVYKDKAI